MTVTDRILWLGGLSLAMCSITGLLFGIWRYGLRGLVRKMMNLHQVIKRTSTMEGSLELLLQGLKDVRNELTYPNSGGTLRGEIRTVLGTLHLQNASFLASFEVNGTMAFKACSDGLFTWTSRPLADFLGMDTQQLLDTGWKNAVYESDRSRVVREYQYAVRDGREVDVTCLFRNNKTARIIAFPIKNKEGEVSEYLGYLKPVPVTMTVA